MADQIAAVGYIALASDLYQDPDQMGEVPLPITLPMRQDLAFMDGRPIRPR